MPPLPHLTAEEQALARTYPNDQLDHYNQISQPIGCKRCAIALLLHRLSAVRGALSEVIPIYYYLAGLVGAAHPETKLKLIAEAQKLEGLAALTEARDGCS